MIARLYLIRHGETTWSKSGQHTSRTDLSLTEAGQAAARKLGERLHPVTFSFLFSSPRRRTLQTCELAGYAQTAEVDADLAEWDYGDYEGLRSIEISEKRPDWHLFRDGCPNGETPEQVSQRADRFLARLQPLEGDVAVFSHGHFGRVLAARWIGLPVLEAQHFFLNPASLSILAFEHHNPAEPVIALWNSTG